MKKVIVVLGPTAIGKSSLGVYLAKELGTDVISGDSVQVYKGLDIGSGKIKEEEMQGVKHHLLDIKEIGEQYSVSEFQHNCRELIDKMDIPLIVGGTGLYIKACLSDYDFSAPKRDFGIEEKYIELDNEQLYQKLLELDNEQAKIIHPNNRKRVLRAIECALAGRKMSELKGENELIYDPYIIYLNGDRDFLYQKINQRVLEMIDEGLVEENRKLYEDRKEVHAIGYQEFNGYFEGEKTLEEVIDDIQKNSRHLAKRQMTWFNNKMNTHIYMIDQDNKEEIFKKVLSDVKDFLRK